jgi:hypothetical protein
VITRQSRFIATSHSPNRCCALFILAGLLALAPAAQPALVTINFDAGFTPGVQAANFLAAYGIPTVTFSGAASAGGPRIEDFTIGNSTVPSPPNCLFQDGSSNDPGQMHRLTFNFSPRLSQLSLTRIGKHSNGSTGPWTNKFYNAAGTLLGSFGESAGCTINQGPLKFTFTAPAGETIARMDLESVWTGCATHRNIPVDDFELTQVPTDFGDAPAPYPTLLANNGAQHVIGGPKLGANVDAETNGQPSANAVLDDTTGSPDDEDGITFTTTAQPGQNLNFTLSGTTGARVDAWIDYNRDGDWADSGEQILASFVLPAAVSGVAVLVPANAQPGLTYARFRISATGGLSFTGGAADGEVEDYSLTIVAPEVDVQGNGISIADGDTTPSSADHTDFGSAFVSGGTVMRTFTIANSGTATLNVTAVTLTGANASDFTVGGFTVPTAIPSGGSTTFTVTFDPSAAGTRSANILVVNDDSDEANYDFAVQGTGDPATLSATLNAGTLTILDTAGRANVWTVRLVNGGADIEITDATEQFQSAPAGGTLSNGDRTLTIPLASVTDRLELTGGADDDRLTIDLGGGDAIPPGGIGFDGQANGTGYHRRRAGDSDLQLHQPQRRQHRDERLRHGELHRAGADPEFRHGQRHHLQPAGRPKRGDARR